MSEIGVAGLAKRLDFAADLDTTNEVLRNRNSGSSIGCKTGGEDHQNSSPPLQVVGFIHIAVSHVASSSQCLVKTRPVCIVSTLLQPLNVLHPILAINACGCGKEFEEERRRIGFTALHLTNTF